MSSNLTHLVQVTIISCLTDPLLLPCPTTISSQQYSKVICLRCRSNYVISWLKHSSAFHLTQRKSQNSCKGLQGFMQSSFSFSLASSATLTLADSLQLQLPSAVLGRLKVYSCLRAFALLVPSAWNDLPNIHVALSLSCLSSNYSFSMSSSLAQLFEMQTSIPDNSSPISLLIFSRT